MSAHQVTCPRCGAASVRMHKGELHDVQEYESGARYLRGRHQPTCDARIAARESWAKREAEVAAAKAEAQEIRRQANEGS